MQELRSTISENKKIASGIYQLKLDTHKCGFDRPGQFAMLEVPGRFLRRPISVSAFDDERYTLVYKVVGDGTRALSRMQPGEEIDALTALGNGYDLDKIPDNSLIVGGGIGVPPMLELVRQLVMAGKQTRVILGFNTAEEMFMEEDFRLFSTDVTVLTDDGSYGKKGMVTDVIDHDDFICACGPMVMLRALSEKCDHGLFSLEARMGCGFGACMGCSIETKEGPMRVCKEGPVFDKELIIWERL